MKHFEIGEIVVHIKYLDRKYKIVKNLFNGQYVAVDYPENGNKEYVFTFDNLLTKSELRDAKIDHFIK